jgi:hypothetical protein
MNLRCSKLAYLDACKLQDSQESRKPLLLVVGNGDSQSRNRLVVELEEVRHATIWLRQGVKVGGVTRYSILERFELHRPIQEIAFKEAVCVAFQRVVVYGHMVPEVIYVKLKVSGHCGCTLRHRTGLGCLRTAFP